MKRLGTKLTALVLVLIAASWWIFSMHFLPQESARHLPEPCAERSFEGQSFVVCTVDLSIYSMELKLVASTGKPYEHLDQLPKPYGLAMNAGMYHQNFSPVGLYVENGRQITGLNTDDGDGNFFMKPNGVFFIDDNGSAGVLETNAYAAADISPQYATQSGPMLVIDGDLHTRFEPDGQSRYIRNGVGVDDSGKVVLAISRQAVSLGRFARLFRDGLECRNALFLDGGISALYDGDRYIVGSRNPAGPMLLVKQKQP